MAVQIKHQFVSAKGDGPDTTKVQPSNWNAAHTLTQATGKVLGRVSAGAGATEEIDWTAFGRGLLNAADAAAVKTLIGKILYADIQDISATSRVLGRKTAGAGPAEELSLTDILDFIGGATRGDILFRGTAGWQRLAAGTAGQFLQTMGASADPNFARVQPLFHTRYVLSSNTAGQTYVSTTWTQCLLNTSLTNEITGASLTSNQISLDAGTYEIDALIPFTARNNQVSAGAMARLQNITDTATVLPGLSFKTSGGLYGTIWVPLRGRFTLAATKTLQLQLWVENGSDTAPAPANTGISEQYTDCRIRKIA